MRENEPYFYPYVFEFESNMNIKTEQLDDKVNDTQTLAEWVIETAMEIYGYEYSYEELKAMDDYKLACTVDELDWLCDK